jgi:hypothetical protein
MLILNLEAKKLCYSSLLSKNVQLFTFVFFSWCSYNLVNYN